MTSRLGIALAALLAASAFFTGHGVARAAGSSCLVSSPSNGSGYKEGVEALPGSLFSEQPRPGPAILYASTPRAPQLENTGIWKAPPIMISGASAYRRGEFVYQGFVYDDTGQTYPAAAQYGGNAANLIEFRMKPQSKSTAIRLTYNTMIDPSVTATTIALGSSSSAVEPMPFGAGAKMPAKIFVTVHGCMAVVTDAATGATLRVSPAVVIDHFRRQAQILLPYSAFDPRGQTSVRVGAASGLWDPNNDQYLRPSPVKPAFFNVAFRLNEPFTGFRDSQQNAALSSGDLSQFFANVDFTKLAANVDDDMPGQPGGVPTTGKMTRIYASHFETAQGRGSYDPALAEAVFPGYQPCNSPCSPEYAGQLQPYDIYVPQRPSPLQWGLTLYHHGCSENYNSYIARGARFADLDGGTSLAATNEARGECIWEYEQAGADIFEVWADIARNYHLDPNRVTFSGQSLGGYATWKNIVQFPDLFSAAAPNIGPPAASGDYIGPPAPPQSGEGTLVYDLLPSLRWVPVIHWVGTEDELVPFTASKPISDVLDSLGYRHSFRAYTGDHFTTGGVLASYDPMGAYVANRRVARNPAHVTYVFSKFMDQPQYGLTSNHAYWLSNITLHDPSGAAPTGRLDVVSHALGVGNPAPQPRSTSVGVYPTVTGEPVPYYGEDLEWGATPSARKSDTLDVDARNISSVTIWVARAGLSCHPTINIVSDGPLTVHLAGC